MPKSKYIRSRLNTSRSQSRQTSTSLSQKKLKKSNKSQVQKIKKVFAEDDIPSFGGEGKHLFLSEKNAKSHKDYSNCNQKKNYGQTDKKQPVKTSNKSNTKNNIQTAGKKRKSLKKDLGTQKSKREYVCIVNPRTQQMTKYLVHQQTESLKKISKRSDFDPPHMTCDQDCESTQQIVRKGVEYSKKDLFETIRKRGHKIAEDQIQ